jgi:hypothetical protein
MPLRDSRTLLRRRRTYLRRVRRWWLIGSAIVGAVSVIDPDWPWHLRRVILWIVTLRGMSRG